MTGRDTNRDLREPSRGPGTPLVVETTATVGDEKNFLDEVIDLQNRDTQAVEEVGDETGVCAKESSGVMVLRFGGRRHPCESMTSQGISFISNRK